jgi:hypothetical protein
MLSKTNTYATLLSSNNYLEGVLCLKLSLDRVNTAYPLLVLVTKDVDAVSRARLISAGCELLDTRSEAVSDSALKSINVDRWRKCFEKLEVFSLTQYAKITWLDADMLVVVNIDHLFSYPHLTGVSPYDGLPGYEDQTFPNAGFWVLEPATGLAEAILARWPAVLEREGTVNDQMLLYDFYRNQWTESRDWNLPNRYNAFVYLLDDLATHNGYNLNIQSPDDQTFAILHFVTRHRPWLMSSLDLFIYFTRKSLKGKSLEIEAVRWYLDLLKMVRGRQ